MSSDIDEDCDNTYASPRGGATHVDGTREATDRNESPPIKMIHSYVNMVDRGDIDEPKPALPARRDKHRSHHGSKPPTQRKSRSKDRERDSVGDYERIKEREKELERIHRRSRELMLSPRLLDCRSRENSLERSKNKIAEHHHRVSAHPSHFQHLPPPPCHPPPPLPSTSMHSHRYKSPSPAAQDHLGPNRNSSLRRRVQSPNRRDFKDFSSHSNRDFRSPNRTNSRFTDDDEDSGADSLNDMMSCQSGHSCRSCSTSHRHNSQHMSLVPYDQAHGCRSCYPHESCCCPQPPYVYSPQNMQLALPAAIEERLLVLEGDKDQLHLQVAILSDQIDNQTEKIGDLEKILDDKKEVLKKTEELLQQEMLNRSSLETTKLELISEISGLKLKHAATEKENSDLRKRMQQTLHLSDISMDGSRSLPRRSTQYREAARETPTRVYNIPYADDHTQKEMTPNRSTTTSVFFGKNSQISPGSVACSSSDRGKSSDRGLLTPTPEPLHPQQNPIATKPKGLKKILSRMRRSNSGSINDDKKSHESEQDREQRNSSQFRASSGGRIAASGWDFQKGALSFDPNVPFEAWNTDLICSWFDNMGLYMYSNEVKRHVKTGDQLAGFTSSDLEVKLGVRHSLHRKKVMLALLAKMQKSEDPSGNLDHQWVVRWLDDVGLPQYKDSFLEARIDGRVLNFLTVDDLFQLKVTNLLHHLSLKRGIQVLRENQFDPTCLKRRGNPGERDSQIVHSDVALWTNHRVMEWLRHVDLSEYAPNLRGSGVHGSLMVHETKFTADLLASLLSIPASKTLLRRHLSLHFKDLVGSEMIQEKRNAEMEPNFQPLTPTSKAKQQPKKGQFTLKRKKSKSEMDFEDMVCPLGSPA